MKMPLVGQILYLLYWETGKSTPMIKQMEISNIAKLNEGKSSYEIYFKSSYNKSRSITQLGVTMFETEEEANIVLKQWFEERLNKCCKNCGWGRQIPNIKSIMKCGCIISGCYDTDVLEDDGKSCEVWKKASDEYLNIME